MKKSIGKILFAFFVLILVLIYISLAAGPRTNYLYALLLLPMIMLTKLWPTWLFVAALIITLITYRYAGHYFLYGLDSLVTYLHDITASTIVYAFLYLTFGKYQIDYHKEAKDLYRDPLTGAKNRRFLTKYLDQYTKQKRNLSVVIFDIDRFKQINDNYGHSTGDYVLSEIYELVRNHIRDTDSVVRLGGEEFAILLPDTDKQVAYKTGERIRKTIQEHEFMRSSQKITVTISVGVAQMKTAESKEELMERADVALYQSKENGRNRTTVSAQ